MRCKIIVHESTNSFGRSAHEKEIHVMTNFNPEAYLRGIMKNGFTYRTGQTYHAIPPSAILYATLEILR